MHYGACTYIPSPPEDSFRRFPNAISCICRIEFVEKSQEHESSSPVIKADKDFTDKEGVIMRTNFEVSDPEYAIALAASAYAVHCLDKSIPGHQRHELRPIRSSIRQPPGYNAPPPPRPVSRTREDQRRVGMTKGQRIAENKADAWEKTQMAKIKKRYERLYSAIISWENEKMLKAKQQMERKKLHGLMELRRANINQHYQSKLARIEHIASGAKRQADEKRKYEESVVKEKAKRIRLTGHAPVTCFCC